MKLTSLILMCCLAATGLVTATPAAVGDERNKERERYELMELFAETFQQIADSSIGHERVDSIDKNRSLEDSIAAMLKKAE